MILIGSDMRLPINGCSPEASIAREVFNRSTNLASFLPLASPRLGQDIYASASNRSLPISNSDQI
jgi:hypothetical protein